MFTLKLPKVGTEYRYQDLDIGVSKADISRRANTFNASVPVNPYKTAGIGLQAAPCSPCLTL